MLAKHFRESVVILFSLILFGCDPVSLADPTEDGSPDGDYESGEYCATVTYYNSNTDAYSEYELSIEVEDGYLKKINWPNGGWLDESHFSDVEIRDGYAEFTSDKGYDYTARITGEGGDCY